MSSIIKGINSEAIDSPDFDRQVKNITRMNPKGSAAEKMILNRFLSSPMYNTQLHGKDFVNTALEWLQRIKVDLTKKFSDADLSDLEDLAHKMYEDYLARIGQLEEGMLDFLTPNVSNPYDLEIPKGYNLASDPSDDEGLGAAEMDIKLAINRANRDGGRDAALQLYKHKNRGGADEKSKELVAKQIAKLHGQAVAQAFLRWYKKLENSYKDHLDLYKKPTKKMEEGSLPPRAGFNKKPKQKGPGYHKDDYEYTEFVPKGKEDKEAWAVKRTVSKQQLKKSEPKSMDTGFYKNYLGNRPVREGEVVSMQARKTPLVVAGSPYDWDIYDLRTNQRVANILGGDRHERPMYEVRIKSSGMTSTKMPPTYVVTAGRNNNPPYYAYELVAPEGGFGKVEKSPGPGGTTKLHPDKEDILRHMMKNLGGGKYYGYDLNMVEEGLDQYQLVEKALGAKIMEIDDAIELGYTDWDPNDSSSIVYLGNKKEKVDELRKDTINNYLSKSSAAVRAGKQERPKKVPSWKVAAGKLYPDKAMGKYAKVPASGIMQGVAETTSTGTSVGSAGIGGGSGIGIEASPIVQAFQNQIDEDTIRPNLAAKLKELGFKGPFKLSQLPKWSKDLIQDDEYAFDADTSIMVRGNDPTLDEFVAKTYDYGYIYGAEGGLNVRLSAEEVLDRVSKMSEHINTPGGMGQSYRKYEVKGPAGYKEGKASGILKGVLQEYNTDVIKDVVSRLPKGLTVDNFIIPAFKEYLFLKYYATEKPNWKELSGPFAQEYRQKHNIKEYKLGDLNHFDDMLIVLPKGLSPEQLNVQGFKEFIYQKHGSKEWPEFKKNRYAYWDAYQKAGGSEKKKFLGLFDDETDEAVLNTKAPAQQNTNNQVNQIKNVLNKADSQLDMVIKEALSAPMQEEASADFDSKFDGLSGKLLSLTQNSKSVSQVLTNYRKWAHEHPFLEGVILTGLNVAISSTAAVAGGGLAATAVCLGILEMLYSKIVHKSSWQSALKKGIISGALSGIIGSAIHNVLHHASPAVAKTIDGVLHTGASTGIAKAAPQALRESAIASMPILISVWANLSENLLNTYGDQLDLPKESSIMKGLQAEEKVDEYKEVPGQRKIVFSKENPPDLYYLYQQFIQRMLNPENTIDPNEWIDKVNKHYGLNYTWKDYQKRGHNDQTNNWQKIIDKYILKKS